MAPIGRRFSRTPRTQREWIFFVTGLVLGLALSDCRGTYLGVLRLLGMIN